MQHGNTSIGLRSRWYDELTSMHWRVLRASFLGWIFDGYETLALVVVLAPMLHSVLTPEQAASTPVYAGIVIGITLLGWGLGGLIGGVLADYVGRKRMMLWSVFLYALFSGLTALSPNLFALCALRFLTGLAMGSEWSTGVALLSETWPERARAKGAGFLQPGFGWGALRGAGAVFCVWRGACVVCAGHPAWCERVGEVANCGARKALERDDSRNACCRALARGQASVHARAAVQAARSRASHGAAVPAVGRCYDRLVGNFHLAAGLHRFDWQGRTYCRPCLMGRARVDYVHDRCDRRLHGRRFRDRCDRTTRVHFADVCRCACDHVRHVQAHAHGRGDGGGSTDQRLLHTRFRVCVDGDLSVRAVHEHRALDRDQLRVQRGADHRVGVPDSCRHDRQVVRRRAAGGDGAWSGLRARDRAAVVSAGNAWTGDA